MAAGEILGLLARVNLAAAAAILLVVAVRKLARPRFGARLAYSLWLLPLLAAIAVLAPARVVIVKVAALATGGTALPVFEGVTAAGPPVAAVTATADPKVLLVALWLAGAAVAALLMAHLQRRFTAEVRKGAIGPAVVGVLAPRIVTPADFEQKFSGEEQALVLAHERAHIARQDSRLNGLSAAIQCLFWFNPLIHLAAHLMRIDQEMACDETVVTRFPEARRAYAQALVKAQLAIRPLPLGCYWPSGTEHPLLERIAMLKRNDLSHRRRLAGGSALAVLCAATAVAAWASQPPQVRIAPAAPVIAGLPAAATPAASAPRASPAAAAASATAPADAQASVDADAAKPERLAQAVALPAPEAHVVPVVAVDPTPSPAVRASVPNVAEAPGQALREYLQCQRAATKALDDGRGSVDTIATQIEQRCEATYQAYRQAWMATAGPGTPEDRGWILDNGRLERARLAVHSSRGAQVRIADIRSCVGQVADQFSSEPFDRVVDQGVSRCGPLIPFPVAPIRHVAPAASGQVAEEKPPAPDQNHDRAIRSMIAAQLRQIVKAKESPPQ